MEDNTHELPWRVRSYELRYPEKHAFGYVTNYPDHPEAPEGKSWSGFCSISDPAGHVTRINEWFTTDEEALRAVEAFVFNSTDDTLTNMERITDA